MSGSRSTGSREPATRPNRDTPTVTMKTETGRPIDPSISFMALEPDGLDAGALLETPLADRDDAVAFGDAGQDLRRVAGGRADPHPDPCHRVASGDEHEVLSVFGHH